MKIDHKATMAGQSVKFVRDMLSAFAWRQSSAGKERWHFDVDHVADKFSDKWWDDYASQLIKQGVLRSDDRANYISYGQRREKMLFYGRLGFPKEPEHTRAAKELIKVMLAEELIEARAAGGYWVAYKGNSLAVAKMLPRINRAKADALLKGAIDRAAIVNSQPENLYWVTEVWVFGSFHRHGRSRRSRSGCRDKASGWLA